MRVIGSGRKKGTPNAPRRQLKELMQKYYPNYDPVVQMAGLAQNPDIPLQYRIACATQVAMYIHPRLKALEVSGEVTHTLEKTIMEAYQQRTTIRTIDQVPLMLEWVGGNVLGVNTSMIGEEVVVVGKV